MISPNKIAVLAAFVSFPFSALADEDWTGFYAGVQLGTSKLQGPVSKDTTPTLGLHAGYDHDFGNYVIGGELSYDAGAKYNDGTGATKTETMRLKLKGGYDLGRTLVYGVVGVGTIDADSIRTDGATYGFGATYKVTDSVTIGAEYLRDDFGKSNGKFDADTVTVRASYRF
jgi:outer membrane immunogenic protein